MPPVGQLLRQLAAGETTARELVDACLAQIAHPQGEGSRTFLQVHAGRARAEADAADRRRRKGSSLPPLAGIPLSIKDLFDVQGDVTSAGSVVLRGLSAAAADAPAVARLRAAGCIVIGRTNMTEFAYSGLGLNPHYGTPLNPFDRAAKRIPGGSSSGAAVAITDGMAAVSLGTDTGGSCRIPAALTGIVGFKPTAWRVPRQGAIPLSTTLDSVGPLARTVEGCALLDAVLAGTLPQAEPEAALQGLRLWVPTTLVLDDLDAHVAATFERSLAALAGAGVSITHAALPALWKLPALNSRGGIAAAEAYAWHRELLERRGSEYDPRVASRILKGGEQSSADAEHPVGHRSEVVPVGLEPLRQPFVLVHRSHSPVAFRHGSDERNAAGVTKEIDVNRGISLFVIPVKDLARAKRLYSTLLDAEPYFNGPYYVGFRVRDQEIGLDPNGHNKGMTGPVAYWPVSDIKRSLQLLLDAGAQAQQEIKDVGGGKLIASVKDADGNVIGLIQAP